MLRDGTLTYISLFSSAGVGCYGFKQAGYECIATNEIIERRLNVQRFNYKCRYESGYIQEDITRPSARDRIFQEIDRWHGMGNDRVDVLIATPPCQGMSVANHKKTDDEIVRNSLVVESIRLVQDIRPRFFVLENVSAFLKTGCTAPDHTVKSIGQVIGEELNGDYIIASRILNFKNYGSNSSRTRTLIIGVEKPLAEYVSPIELYPDYRAEKPLEEVVGAMPPLEWGEICPEDFYHAFRTYPEEMRGWIHGMPQGQSAFDNEEEIRRPHRVDDGKIVFNQRKNGDKYTRQCWNRTGPCIHTRNDQLASQNTVHPSEDRVFSIRELMKLMTIPDEFKWVKQGLEELNSLEGQEKERLLKREEIKIRQSIGEAVPTSIFCQIAVHVKEFMGRRHFNQAAVNQEIAKYGLTEEEKLMEYLSRNPQNVCNATLARIAELSNTKRESHSAYYTNKFILNEIFTQLPELDGDEVHILEPSVGVGNFLPFIFKKYEYVPRVCLDVVDIDGDNLKILKLFLGILRVPDNFRIRFINADFLNYPFENNACYDLTIGNPPFTKLKRKEALEYLKQNENQGTTNTFEFFLEKALRISRYVVMITPKALLNTSEFQATRSLLEKKRMECIEDFGELGFKGVLVETVCLFVNTCRMPGKTLIYSMTLNKRMVQKQSYIMDKRFPYWIIYRDDFFDEVSKKLEFDRFQVFRDRQITNSLTVRERTDGAVRVLKSRNISEDGREVISIPGYDAYIDFKTVSAFNAAKYINRKDVYLTPNMTYKPRVIPNVPDTVVNGSVAVLIPKQRLKLSKAQLAYYAGEEYRRFYKIARNYQTRSLNVDAASVFFYGILKEDG